MFQKLLGRHYSLLPINHNPKRLKDNIGIGANIVGFGDFLMELLCIKMLKPLDKPQIEIPISLLQPLQNLASLVYRGAAMFCDEDQE